MSRTIVVDTNIIVSTLISNNRKTRQILSNKDFEFVAPKFLIVELFKHSLKIQKVTKLSEDEVLEVLSSIINQIKFYDDSLISIGNWVEALRLCRNVDEKDTPYIALALELDATILTNDRELKIGLNKKGFDEFMNLQKL